MQDNIFKSMQVTKQPICFIERALADAVYSLSGIYYRSLCCMILYINNKGGSYYEQIT